MNPYQAEKMASQHGSELRALSARSGHARQARQARQAQRARRAGQPLAHHSSRHLIRRRAGWVLISLGLRLAYAAGAGED